MGCCCFKNIPDADDDENLSESRVIMAYTQEAHNLK